MSRRTEIQVGVTVLIALAILLWGVTWLKEFSLARRQRVWMVHFEQTGGLAQSDEVQVNGIRKGDVQRVDLVSDGVLVHLALASDIGLTRDCVVSVRNVGLMGEKVIFVTWRDTGVPYTPADTIPGLYEKGIPEVMAALGPAMGTVSMLTQQLQSIAIELNQHGDITESMKNLRAASEGMRAAVQENRVALRQTLANFESASRTTKALTTDREAQLRAAMDHFASSAEKLDHLAGRLDSLRGSLQAVGNRIESGKGTLGKLVNDDRVYEDTRATLAELKALIADVKAHPKKYLTVKIF
jgi:phospholipid/cholesterol/gamma-HCH transport system substrate-binding protein